MFHIELKN